MEAPGELRKQVVVRLSTNAQRRPNGFHVDLPSWQQPGTNAGDRRGGAEARRHPGVANRSPRRRNERRRLLQARRGWRCVPSPAIGNRRNAQFIASTRLSESPRSVDSGEFLGRAGYSHRGGASGARTRLPPPRNTLRPPTRAPVTQRVDRAQGLGLGCKLVAASGPRWRCPSGQIGQYARRGYGIRSGTWSLSCRAVVAQAWDEHAAVGARVAAVPVARGQPWQWMRAPRNLLTRRHQGGPGASAESVASTHIWEVEICGL